MLVLNIIETTKGLGEYLAPTMKLMASHVKGTVDEAEYIQQYTALLDARFDKNPQYYEAIGGYNSVMLQCYHEPDVFCHRCLAVRWLQAKLKDKFTMIYGGEVIMGRVRRLCISGSRAASPELKAKVHTIVTEYIDRGFRPCVGDAEGVDQEAIFTASNDNVIMELWWPKAVGLRRAVRKELLIECATTMPESAGLVTAAQQYVDRTIKLAQSAQWQDEHAIFWNGESKGTAHYIRAAKAGGMPGTIFMQTGEIIPLADWKE